MMYNFGYMEHFCGLYFIVHGLIGLGLLALVIFLIIYFVRRSKKAPAPTPAQEAKGNELPVVPTANARALEILSERYAKGEINDEEYKQKKENLTKE